MNSSPKLTIIIISWNTKALLLQSLESVYEKNKVSDFEVIVVDNNSSDGSVAAVRQRYPQVRLICNKENLGYARANNIGMQHANGDIFVLLNSDAEFITKEPLLDVVDSFERRPDIGVLGGVLYLPSGRIQAVGRSFLSLKMIIKQQLMFQAAPLFKQKALSSRQILRHVDYVDGAFFCIPRFVVEKTGMFDESFFMYGEDMEWCKRIKRFGKKIVVRTDIEILHHHAASSKQNFHRVLVENTISNSRFIAEQEGVAAGKKAFYSYVLGMIFRVCISPLRRFKLVREYWGAALECLSKRHELKKMLT